MIDVENVFKYHAPTAAQMLRYEDVRQAARRFTETLLANCPESADLSAAIRKVREAVMTANASIALDGK